MMVIDMGKLSRFAVRGRFGEGGHRWNI
jgi:hypothetical protein